MDTNIYINVTLKEKVRISKHIKGTVESIMFPSRLLRTIPSAQGVSDFIDREMSFSDD